MSLGDHALDLSLLVHSSQELVPSYSPLQAPVCDLNCSVTFAMDFSLLENA